MEAAQGLLALGVEDVLPESPAKEVLVIFRNVGRPVLLEVEVLLMVTSVVAAGLSRAVAVQVKVEALAEVAALGRLAVVMEVLRAESPAKYLPVILPTLDQVVLLLVVLFLGLAVPRAVAMQVSSHPALVVMPKNQMERQLQEPPLELWPQQRQWLP